MKHEPTEKQQLREAMRRQRARLTWRQVRAAAAAATARLLALPAWSDAGILFCHLAILREMRTDLLIAAARREQRRICVPAFCRRRRAYYPAWLPPASILRCGPLRIPEPRDPAWFTDGRIDLAVVPGLAFDREGARLGHGGGHYDRLLAMPQLRGCVKYGWCFDFQVVAQLPVCAWDVNMDAVITEKDIYGPAPVAART
ncbi:MAG: 5-formyltetrahydrofolate cyclo-ligase [Kiritimatiellia bacterium]